MLSLSGLFRIVAFIAAGALLVRVEPEAGGDAWDGRASIPGIVDRQLHADGDRVGSGDELTVVRPESTHVMQALLGLYMVGTRGDISLIQPYQRPREGLGPQVAQQARQTLERIREGPPAQPVGGAPGGSI